MPRSNVEPMQKTPRRSDQYLVDSKGKGICRRKKRFADDAQAKAALKLIVNTQDGREKPARIYFCFVCSGYHLTKREM